jgi:hypothetical protein
VASKEVAIRARAQRYLDQETLVHYLAAGLPFDGTWAGEPIQTVVAWQREPYVADLLARGLPPLGFVESARFGDYIVYAAPSPPAARYGASS